jgi:hypothetical protein
MGLGNEGIGPDGTREWTTLLPEEISKLGSPLRFYTAVICIRMEERR